MYQVFNDDCLNILTHLEDSSVDSVVTDPPAGISFMAADWDSNKGGRTQWIAWLTEIMRESLRVLKPGGHMLVWALPRTSHWTATAIEDAGFEIRDVVHHLFSSGMPKSHDISKAIDKQAKAVRPIIGQATRSQHRHTYGLHHHGEYAITTPATPDAATWQGWGTALKPAAEHWILARKPIQARTVAQNVLQHGTGAINIDGCRVPPAHGEQVSDQPIDKKPNYKNKVYGRGFGGSDWALSSQGRWPANVVLTTSDDSGTPDRIIDKHGGGYSKSKRSQRGKVKIFDKERYGVVDSGWRGESTERGFDDEGGASRFFMRFVYCPKASPSERGKANNHPTVKGNTLMHYLVLLITPPGGTVLDPFMGSGSTGVACLEQGFNFVGIEKEQSFYAIAVDRLAQADGEGSDGNKENNG